MEFDDFDPDGWRLPPPPEPPDSPPPEREVWGGAWLGSEFDQVFSDDPPSDLGFAVYAGLARVRPGLVELARLGSTDFSTLDESARVDALVAFDRCRSWLDAQQELLLALISTEDSTEDRWCAEEVGAALRLSSGSARSRLKTAEQLCERLPQTLQALAGGQISANHAAAITEASFELPDDLLPAFEGQVLKQADQQSVGQLRRSARRALLSLDPATALQKHQRAVAGRQVRIAPADHGMAWLSALLPADEARLVWNRLDGAARSAPAGDPRTRDQLRADALVNGMLNSSEGHQPTAHGRQPTINVTVGLTTLAGTDDEPGWLDGYGPITAEHAREIAHDPSGTWRRIITDPVTGQLLDYGSTRYRPPQQLADHVITRDGECTFPFCSHSAHTADLDHVVPYPRGGTSASNLQPLDRRHHNAKTRGGWQSSRNEDGTTTWTSRGGRSYTTGPPLRWAQPPETEPPAD
ncbi:MAG: HNH endonuclease [Actinomycetota bacterium]|nr:HNH endonuclease [Actinomycetota bacterium]MDQ2958138.1 HNH endonuclease [Actinomycetota bacterium]